MRYDIRDLKERLSIEGICQMPAPALVSGRTPSPIRSLCVTGATGWLGRHVLQALTRYATMCHPVPLHVVVPVRADNPFHALMRLRQAWASQPALLTCLDRSTAPLRLTIVPTTSLAHPLPRLPLQVDGVVHCAADMSLAFNLDQAWGANVDAVRHLWQWAWDHGARRFDHVSTLSVFVAADTPSGLVQEYDPLDRAQALYGGYAASKWCAEAWLMQAAGLDVCIHRLGLLSFSSELGWAPGDGLAAWAQAWKTWGRPPFITSDVSSQVDFSSPVTAAQGIVDSLTHGSIGVMHWNRPTPVPAQTWIEIMEQLYGNKAGQWPLHDPLGKLALRAVGRWSHPARAQRWWWHDLFQSTKHLYDTTHASQLFQSSPWQRNELVSALLKLP